MKNITDKLDEMGIVLPNGNKKPSVLGNYVPSKIVGQNLYISGQISIKEGTVLQGKLGEDLSLEEGIKAARWCAENIITQCFWALGSSLESLKRVSQIVKLGGFVNASPDFHEIPKVIDGASEVITSVFGEAGRHTRFAVGCSSLPLNAAVEIEAIIFIKD